VRFGTASRHRCAGVSDVHRENPGRGGEREDLSKGANLRRGKPCNATKIPLCIPALFAVG